VSVTDDSFAVDLADGRTITVPIAWFPRLENGTPLSVPIGVSSEAETEFTGLISTRISAS
jgi:hypothetical protein